MPRANRFTVPDCSDRRAVVTGATGGVGLGLATRLAAAGAEVVLPVRDSAAGDAALATIRDQVCGANVSLRELDLSSLSSVSTLGRTLNDEGRPIHLLVNTAGVMAPPRRQVTVDGHELQMGANHLGHFALVAHLMPLLSAGRARVTSQLGVGVRSGTISWDDLSWHRSYDPLRAHQQSQVALGLFGLELERRSRARGWGITSNLAHPGAVPTDPPAGRPDRRRQTDAAQVRRHRALSRLGLVGTVDTAVLPTLVAATSPQASGGRLYGPRWPGRVSGHPAERTLHPPLTSTEDARRSWAVSLELTRVSFPTATGLIPTGVVA